MLLNAFIVNIYLFRGLLVEFRLHVLWNLWNTQALCSSKNVFISYLRFIFSSHTHNAWAVIYDTYVTAKARSLAISRIGQESWPKFDEHCIFGFRRLISGVVGNPWLIFEVVIKRSQISIGSTDVKVIGGNISYFNAFILYAWRFSRPVIYSHTAD